VLPAAFRKAVTESSGGKGLLSSPHDKWDCLIGYGLSRRDGLRRRSTARKKWPPAHRMFDRDMRSFQLYDCAEISFDGSGRFHPRASARAGRPDRCDLHQAPARFSPSGRPKSCAPGRPAMGQRQGRLRQPDRGGRK
jgi:MraZ protein